MNAKDFLRLGVPLGEASRRATDFVAKFILGGGDKSRLREEVAAIVANPSVFVVDSLRDEFAKALLKAPPPPRAEPVKYRQWGEGLEHDAVMQMEKACLLPVSVAGALMPDAHVGYGLPIGGVLATDNAVIPYAVGVDIACRMKMTVLDIPLRDLEQKRDRLTRAIEAETRFGRRPGTQLRVRVCHICFPPCCFRAWPPHATPGQPFPTRQGFRLDWR
jgi:tRNA-splicing ligase RtcB